MTNLIVLSVAILTNTEPALGVYTLTGNKMVGVKDVTYAFQHFKLGYMDGAKPVELIDGRKLLWVKTNWHEMSIGVVVPDKSKP